MCLFLLLLETHWDKQLTVSENEKWCWNLLAVAVEVYLLKEIFVKLQVKNKQQTYKHLNTFFIKNEIEKTLETDNLGKDVLVSHLEQSLILNVSLWHINLN